MGVLRDFRDIWRFRFFFMKALGGIDGVTRRWSFVAGLQHWDATARDKIDFDIGAEVAADAGPLVAYRYWYQAERPMASASAPWKESGVHQEFFLRVTSSELARATLIFFLWRSFIWFSDDR